MKEDVRRARLLRDLSDLLRGVPGSHHQVAADPSETFSEILHRMVSEGSIETTFRC